MVAFLGDFDRERHVAKLWKYYVGLGRARDLLPKDWRLDAQSPDSMIQQVSSR